MEKKIRLLSAEKLRAKETETPEQKLLNEIREVCRKIETAYENFGYEQDDDLVEASIYEIEALKARYRYLLRLAKSQNVTSEANIEKCKNEWVIDKMG